MNGTPDPVRITVVRCSRAKPQASDIRARSFKFSLRAVKLYQSYRNKKDGAGWILGKQYLRAATSIGANIEEAQSAESRADFVHKLGIAQKEATGKLVLASPAGGVRNRGQENLKLLTRETEELIAVITSIIVSTKRKRPITEYRPSNSAIHNS